MTLRHEEVGRNEPSTSWGATVYDIALKNWLFLVLLAVGALLRVMVWFAYKPAILLLGDTIGYLRAADGVFRESPWRPVFYALFVEPSLAVGSLALTTALQHVLILVVAVALYVLLRRLDVHPLFAAIGTTPLLLDGYQLNLEQHILAEALFETLATMGVVLLAWRRHAPIWVYGAAGILLALSAVTRFTGLALLPVALLFVVVQRAGWIRILSIVAGFAVALGSYLVWNREVTGVSGLTNRTGFVMYGKVATFADCRGVRLPRYERQLCIDKPASERAASYAAWQRNSPLRKLDVPEGVDKAEIARSFSIRFIRRQPLDYGMAAASDFLQFFAWRTPEEQQPSRVTRWQFFVNVDEVEGVFRGFRENEGSAPPEFGLGDRLDVAEGPAQFLRRYQDFVYPSGPLLTLSTLLGLLGAAFGRASGNRPDSRRVCLLLTISGLALLGFPAIFAHYHYRYIIPVLPLLFPAGALGAWLLVQSWRSKGRRATQMDAKSSVSK